MFKKLLTSVLALCLLMGTIFTAFPVAVAATETSTETSATKALSFEESFILKETVLINTPKVAWKYYADGTDPAAGLDDLHAWASVDFDDSAWNSGNAPLGVKRSSGVDTSTSPIYSSTSIKTLLPLTPEGETGGHYKGYFFRKTIDLSSVNLEEFNALYIDVAMNDSVVLYVNGNEVLNTCVDTSKAATSNLYYSNGTLQQKQFRVYFKDYDNLLVEGKNVIAAEIHNGEASPNDVYFAMNKLSLIDYQPKPYAAEMVVLTPGVNQAERNLAWLSNIEKAGEVRLTEKSNVEDGLFPAEYTAFDASSDPTEVAFEKYAKKATVKGLKENTEYAYVIAADGTVSEIYYFATGSFSSFDFVFVGDPQIGTSDEHSEAWKDSMNKITTQFDPDFIVSAGDQVDSNHSEKIYANFISDYFTSVPFAPTVGPGHESPGHDDAYTAFGDHYNLPNLSEKNGAGLGSADYWYVYNNTLFIHLNMAAKGSEGIDGHKRMLEEATEANPDVTWRMVVMHNSLYSTSTHSTDASTQTYKTSLVPAFEQYNIDMVISGHDHVYVRSKPLIGSEPTDEIVNSTVTCPEGIVYLCANSSTSTKHYGKKLTDTPFVASENYETRKSAIRFVVTDNSITMVSYFIDGDTPEVFDTFTIKNTEGDILSENVVVTGKSVSLGELIDMNIYLSTNNSYTGVATLTCGNKTVKIDLATLTPDENGIYKLSIPLTSIDMAKDVTLTVDGGTYVTSIKEYAEELISLNENDYYTKIAKALLNYGAYAQEYFAEKNSDPSLLNVLANESLSDSDKTVPALNADDLAKYEFVAEGMTKDVYFIGVSLVLDSKTDIKLYFNASADATVTVDGEECEKYIEKDGSQYVILTLQTPQYATTAFDVKITDGGAAASTSISLYTAIHAALINPAVNAKLIPLLNAYAAYCNSTVITVSTGIIYNLNKGELPSGAPTEYDPKLGTALPVPTRSGDVFAGWYTTPTFDAGTRMFSIPAGTTGDVTLYAKYVKSVIDIDWEDYNIDLNDQSANQLLKNSNGKIIANIRTTGNAGATAKIMTDEKNSKYLLFSTGTSNPDMFIYYPASSSNTYGSYEKITDGVTCVSFTFDLSLNENSSATVTHFRMRAEKNTTGDKITKKDNTFLVIDKNGNVCLVDNSTTIKAGVTALKTDEVTTVRLVIDFGKQQLRLYDANGNVLDSATLNIHTSATGATSGEEYMQCFGSLMQIFTIANKNGSALRYYGISIAENDIFAN